MYPDGTLVRGPKALCELQGYVFDAWLRMAQIYDELDNKRRANALRAKAAVSFRRDDTGPKALPNIGRHRQYLFVSRKRPGDGLDQLSGHPQPIPAAANAALKPSLPLQGCEAPP